MCFDQLVHTMNLSITPNAGADGAILSDLIVMVSTTAI
jgi:hypothetical protein